MQRPEGFNFRVESLSYCRLFGFLILSAVAISIPLISSSIVRAKPFVNVDSPALSGASLEQFLSAPLVKGSSPPVLSIVTPLLFPANQEIAISLIFTRKNPAPDAGCSSADSYCPSLSFGIAPLWFGLTLETSYATSSGLPHWRPSKFLGSRLQKNVAENGTVSFEIVKWDRSLTCGASAVQCADLNLVIVTTITAPRYRLNVTFEGDAVSDHAKTVVHTLVDLTASVVPRVRFTNAKFTSYEEILRIVLLCFTVVVFLVYLLSMHRLSLRMWRPEQKFLALLLLLLMVFNNPLFPLSNRIPSVALSIVNVVFMSTYLCGFLAGLLIITDLMAKDSIRPTLRFTTFYLPKLLLLGAIWLLGVASYSYAYSQGHADANPAARDLDAYASTGYPLFRAARYVLLGVYFIWLALLVFTLFAKFSKEPPTARTRFYVVWGTALAMSVVILAGMIHLHGLGTTGELTTVELTAFYTIYNVFTWMLAFMYSPPVFGGSVAMRGARQEPVAPVDLQGDDELFFDDE